MEERRKNRRKRVYLLHGIGKLNSMDMQLDGLKTTAPSFDPTPKIEANLNKFLRLSTPVVHNSSLAGLFRAINELYAFGFKFEYKEDKHTDLLVYVPYLSVVRMRFKKKSNIKALELECPANCVLTPYAPLDFLRSKTEGMPQVLSELEKVDHSSLDCRQSYFAIRWVFNMNLREKTRID